MSNGKGKVKVIKAVEFQCVSFFDPKQERQIVILYTLGEDGILREFTNGKWTPFAITE